MHTKDHAERLVLFFCCCIILFLQPADDFKVVPLIIAVIAVGFTGYFDSGKVRLLIGLIFGLLCLIHPPLSFFLPALLYELFDDEPPYFALLLLLPLAWTPNSLVIADRLLILLVALPALLIKQRALKYALLRRQYLELTDTAKELDLKMRSQHQALLDRQDDDLRLATLNERNRIAREIHDHVGHQLSSALLQIGALLAINRDGPMTVALNTIKTTLSTAMDNIRSSVHNLYETSIDLNDQVEQLVSRFTFCPIILNLDLQTCMDVKLKYALIAIIKEGLANIMKHSDATQVTLTLREHPGFYQLILSDNGHVRDYRPEDGIGLKTITERVETLRGHILIRTKNGFELFITLPKETS